MRGTARRAAMAAIVIWVGAVAGRAGDEHMMMPTIGSKEFEAIKKLEGHWEGTTEGSKDKGPEKVSVDYHVTSAGSAVVETLFAGTPHEMVSVYHDENGRLAMTHYCAMKNQPRFSLASASASEISLEVGKNGGVDPMSGHMHALTLAWPSPNQLVETWTAYEGGKKAHTTTITLVKKT